MAFLCCVRSDAYEDGRALHHTGWACDHEMFISCCKITMGSGGMHNEEGLRLYQNDRRHKTRPLFATNLLSGLCY